MNKFISLRLLIFDVNLVAIFCFLSILDINFIIVFLLVLFFSCVLFNVLFNVIILFFNKVFF